MILSSSPLQGITDDVFRSVHHEVFGGIDEYFGPYVRLENHKEPKKSQLKDASSELNEGLNYIPQILSSQAELILKEAERLKDLGHQQVNWNLGCPYPMVSKRNMGAGLLNQPSLVEEVLESIMPKMPLGFSIKCRLGLESDQDIIPLIDIFNEFNIDEVIIHARTAKQMYKGSAKPEKIIPLLAQSKHPIVYNGDLNSIEDIKQVQTLFGGKIEKLMLGRGLIMKPHLAKIAKDNKIENLQKDLYSFHEKLIAQYLNKFQGHQLVPKMRGVWEYLSHSFADSHKVFKLIKKAKSWSSYNKNTDLIFHQFDLDE